MKLNKWNENIDRRIVLGWARKLCSVADRISSVLMKNSVGFTYETKPRGDDVEIYLQGDTSNLSGK